MKKIVLLAFVFVLSLSGCEKDDICDSSTATTPRLVITFYDVNNSLVKKNVTDLKVIGEGETEGIVFNPDATGEEKYLANGNSISIPLQTDKETTSYRFILNAANTNPVFVNTDNLTFNYTHKNEYVSRACGYKTLFYLNPNNALTHTDATIPDGFWMQFVLVATDNIINENETHIKVYF